VSVLRVAVLFGLVLTSALLTSLQMHEQLQLGSYRGAARVFFSHLGNIGIGFVIGLVIALWPRRAKKDPPK
jgi:hypothetical protein